MSASAGAVPARTALAVFIAWSLWLPLADVLAYPDRVSVLPNLQTDAAAYHDIGSALARTRSLEALPPKHPPGWVALLGAIYSITGPSYIAGKLASWMALIFSTAACAFIARRAYGSHAAWTAAVLCASSPALRGYVGTLQYEVFTGAVLLLVLLLAIRTIDARTAGERLRRAVLTGLAAGLLILTRETFAVVVPVIAMWVASRVSASMPRRAAAIAGIAILVTAMAPAIAWSAVQSIRYHTLITISEKGPMVVELGNNPLANGTYNAPLVGIGQPTGLAFVREFPGRASELAGRKILYFWGVLRDGWNVPRPVAVWMWRASTGLVPLDVLTAIARGGWLLAFFVTSLWMLGRRGLADWWIMPAAVLIMMGVHVALLSSHRFAVPVLPVVFVLVSGPVAALVVRLASFLRSPVPAAAVLVLVAIVVAMQFQSWPLQIEKAAVDLDGASADNHFDPVAQHAVRVADAQRGERPVALLTDEYLPRGPLRVEVGMRRAAADLKTAPVARIALLELDGHVSCAREIPADALASDRFTVVAVPCRLTRDTPATLAIFSLGVADLAIDTVRLVWTSPRTR